MTSRSHREVVIKVPVELRKKLVKILKRLPSQLKFEELSLCMETIYKMKIELCSSPTNINEVILVINNGSNKKLLESLPEEHTDEELAEFKNLLERIDFQDDINDTLQPLLAPDFLKKYVEIKIRVKVSTTGKLCTLNFFDKWSWKINEIHSVFIGHIYDPSKFWIRFGRVDVFQKRLWNFYDEKKDNLKMKLADISINLDCVVFIADLYYRGRIVRTDLQDITCYRIFLYDFGMVTKATVSQLFHMDEFFKNFPAFAVRAMLTNTSSLDEQMWQEECVKRFTELTEDKDLYAQIVNVHKKRKILEINLFDKNVQKKDKVINISYRLVHEGLAKVAWHPIVTQPNKNEQYKPIREFLYLFPTFEMIENGTTPSKVHSVEELKKRIPWDVLFPDFYTYDTSEVSFKSNLY